MTHSIGHNVVPPLHRAWDPDDSIDFHAARLLVLLRICGTGKQGTIEGRTKLAKLDFLLRYPLFLGRAYGELQKANPEWRPWRPQDKEVEAPMIRYRFGPWDTRYRQFLAFLQSRGLIRIGATRIEKVSLTAAGARVADSLMGAESFAPLVERCEVMRGTLSDFTGTELKDLVYRLFPTEVGDLRNWNEILQ